MTCLHLSTLALTQKTIKKILFVLKFLIFKIYFFRKRGRKGEREGEKHQCVVASHTPPTGDLACNPGMCPD